MSDDLATAYALRAREEARPALIRDIAIARLGRHGTPNTSSFACDDSFSRHVAKVADNLLCEMYPTGTARGAK